MIKNNDKDFDLTDVTDFNDDLNQNLNENEDIGVNRFKSQKAKKNLKVRVLSTIVLLALLIIFVGSGAIYTSFVIDKPTLANVASYFSIALTLFLTGLCIFEMNKTMGFKYWYYQILIITLSLFIYLYPINSNLYNFSFYQNIHLNSWVKEWQFPTIVIIFITIFIIIGFSDRRIDIKNALINVVMVVLIIFAFKGFSIVSLSLADGKAKFSFNTILWIWGIVIFSDTFQYIGGMRFGKTKLAPRISPKKTWEGALIGLSAGAVFGIAYAMLFTFVTPLKDFQPLREAMVALGTKSLGLEVTIILLLAIVFPIIGLFGDLLFSAIKRYVNIKDYSNLIPGHGGALDRLDSIIFSLFITFILISVLPI